jgi:hypothetical protein
MFDQPVPDADAAEPSVYELRIEGHLGPQWSDWFGGLTITPDAEGNTLVAGPVVDQAALHGVLKRIRDLGMPLVSVNRVARGQADAMPSDRPIERCEERS